MPRIRRKNRSGFYEPDDDPQPFGPQERTIGADTDPRELVRQRDAARPPMPSPPRASELAYARAVADMMPSRRRLDQALAPPDGRECTRRVVLRATPPEAGDWDKSMTWRSPMETAIAITSPIVLTDVGVEPDELAAYMPGGSLARGFLHLDIEQTSGARVHDQPRKSFRLDVTDMMDQHLFGEAVRMAVRALREQGVPKPHSAGGSQPAPPESSTLHQWLETEAVPSRLVSLRKQTHAAEGECLVFYVEHPTEPVMAGLVVCLRYFELAPPNF